MMLKCGEDIYQQLRQIFMHTRERSWQSFIGCLDYLEDGKSKNVSPLELLVDGKI